MKKQIILILLSLISISIQAQTEQKKIEMPEKPSMHLFAAYGKYSITQLQNPELYENLNSTGDFFGGILLDLPNKIDVGMLVGFENTNPTLKGATNSKNYFANTSYAGVSLQYSYYQTNRIEMYAGIASLLVKTQKNLPTEEGITFSTALDFTILGIQYTISKRFACFLSVGAGEAGFVRAGLRL
jgi:hypothetical protein